MDAEQIQEVRRKHKRNAAIKALWRAHSGSKHGPHIKTYTIPLGTPEINLIQTDFFRDSL